MEKFLLGLFGKGPTMFSSSATAEEVTAGIDATGLTVIITGASSGIGSETARVLALRGAHVIMAVRNLSAGEKVKQEIVKENPTANVDIMEIDLASKASVRKFASDYNSRNLPLNILINNAGIMAPPFMLSKDGIELQFATNYLGHFLLTDLLLDTMRRTSATSNIEGRIVNVSSELHRVSYSEGIRFDKINDKSSYNSICAYGQSKVAKILHANELARRFKEENIGITANSLHPGVIASNVLRHRRILHALQVTVGKLFLENVQKGAAASCFVALHPQLKGVSGKYFNRYKMTTPSAKATDMDLAKKLWDFSMDMVN